MDSVSNGGFEYQGYPNLNPECLNAHSSSHFVNSNSSFQQSDFPFTVNTHQNDDTFGTFQGFRSNPNISSNIQHQHLKTGNLDNHNIFQGFSSHQQHVNTGNFRFGNNGDVHRISTQQINTGGLENNDTLRGFTSKHRDNILPNGQGNTEPIQTYGITLERPKHQQYAIKSARLSSYRGFPSYVHQSAESLVEAGFFYSGKEDIVFCYHCGQGLRSWEPEDDPWVEHALWSPKCVHLYNVKGFDFVKRVQQSQEIDSKNEHKSNESEYTSPGISKCQKDSVDSSRTEKSNNTIPKPAGRRDLLKTIAAQSVVTFGYTEEMVERAIQIYIKQNHNTNFAAADLMNIILDIEEGKLTHEDNTTSAEIGIDNDYTCTQEKDESIENNSLREQNRQLKDQTVCKICLDETVSIVFLPCGHLCCCSQCAPAMRNCPICREHIKGTVKTYLV